MALAYLPSDRIPKALKELKNFVKTQQPGQVLEKKWDKFWAYFDKEWMRIVKPKNFSVYNALDRTDNRAENYHRWLNNDLGCKPLVPIFIGKFIMQFTKMPPFFVVPCVKIFIYSRTHLCFLLFPPSR